MKWLKPKAGTGMREEGRLVEIDVPGTLKQVVWHGRGDYFSSVASEGEFRRFFVLFCRRRLGER